MSKCVLRPVLLGIYAVLLPFFLHAQDLSLSLEDLRIELRPDGGYHLFVRQKPDISSVLLTETTRDPRHQAANYAYRAAEWNDINGNEIRLINESPIPPENRIYSLVSSTPQSHPELGSAYHIYIPHVLYYGYEGGRQGEVHVGDGTYLNIRTFHYAYADYRGAFKDNPFMLQLLQDLPPSAPPGTFIKETVAAFTEIAGLNTLYSGGSADMAEQIGGILRKEQGKTLDVVICLDTTGSMRRHVEAVRSQLIDTLKEIVPLSPSLRLGMVLYRDYREEYLTKIIPFTSDFEVFQKNLNGIRVGGGGDIPEAVYEALYAGATGFSWEAESRIMILVGDAPPHPRPRGRISKQTADSELASREIKIHAIIMPQ